MFLLNRRDRRCEKWEEKRRNKGDEGRKTGGKREKAIEKEVTESVGGKKGREE